VSLTIGVAQFHLKQRAQDRETGTKKNTAPLAPLSMRL
jgi:hypothetical protein